MKNVSIFTLECLACFDEILSIVKEDITKMDTNYREAISAEERLANNTKVNKQHFLI